MVTAATALHLCPANQHERFVAEGRNANVMAAFQDQKNGTSNYKLVGLSEVTIIHPEIMYILYSYNIDLIMMYSASSYKYGT